MKRVLGLRWRLVRTYLILIAIAMTFFVLWVGFALQKAHIEQREHELEVEAFFIASALEEGLEQQAAGTLSHPLLSELVVTFGQRANAHLTVVDLQGYLLADSQSDPGGLSLPPGNLSDQPNIIAALTGQEQHVIHLDDAGQEVLSVAAPIHHGDEILGAIRLAVPTAGLRAEIRRQWLLLAGAGLLVALATTAVSLWLAGGILRPVQTLTRAAREIADGALDRRIAVDTEDELGKMGRAFNQMADRVAEMLAQQRAFVANASHELRTPLTSIRLWTEALLDGAKDDAAMAIHFLKEIEAQTDRLSHLVEELLDLSRLESGLVLMNLTPTALPELVRDVATELQPQMEQKGLTVRLDVPHSLPQVPLDRDQIRQVLINLLDNARRYTPAGGCIGIRVDWHTDGTNQFSDPPDCQPSSLLLSVTDSGQGIPADDLPHIFERFYRSDKARSSVAGGAGLGLAIVKSIVEAHGGQVWAESRVGEGTTVSFTLPLRPQGH